MNTHDTLNSNIPEMPFVSSPIYQQQQVIYTDKARQSKESLRNQINAVADPQTREGIVSDSVAVLMVGLSEIIVGLSTVASIADVKKVAQKYFPLAEQIKNAVDSGAIVFPYQVKTGGIESVLSDLTHLTNGVSNILKPDSE